MFNKKENNSDLVDVNSMVEFTLLDPRATEADLEKLCDIAYKNSYYGVCVNPCNVAFVKGYIQSKLNSSLKVVSVVGFPLGANSSETKRQEALDVIRNGADEIDVVINIGFAKQGKFGFVKNEIKKIKSAAKKHIVKVIIETCYFNLNEILKLSKICVQCKVDYIKTSTGFGTGGAKVEDVSAIYEHTKGLCKIKASGGIHTRQMAIDLVNAGASRIGTSHII